MRRQNAVNVAIMFFATSDTSKKIAVPAGLSIGVVTHFCEGVYLIIFC
jgi:ABC-type enterobactin transport system permease subunit